MVSFWSSSGLQPKLWLWEYAHLQAGHGGDVSVVLGVGHGGNHQQRVPERLQDLAQLFRRRKWHLFNLDYRHFFYYITRKLLEFVYN